MKTHLQDHTTSGILATSCPSLHCPEDKVAPVHAFSKGRESAKYVKLASGDRVVDMKLPETLPSKWFQTQFQKRLDLRRFVDAREAWDRLQQEGCEPSILMACLEVYSQHVAAKREDQASDSYIREFLETNALEVGEAEKLAIDLEQDASRIEQLGQRPTFLREITWWEDRRPNLPDDLRSHASWLKTCAKKIRSPFNLRDQPGQVIRLAMDYIKKMTGQDHISDLAKLVRAAYTTVGIDEDVDENTLGKVGRRARGRLKKKTK